MAKSRQRNRRARAFPPRGAINAKRSVENGAGVAPFDRRGYNPGQGISP